MAVSAEAVDSGVKDSGAAASVEKGSDEADSVEKDSGAVSAVKDSGAAASEVKASEAVSVEKVVNPESISDVSSEVSWDNNNLCLFFETKYKTFF